MQSWFTFELDGESCRVEQESTQETLAAYLGRGVPGFERFGGESRIAGSLPVVLGEVVAGAPRFRTVDAQRLLLPMVADCQVWTPEGIRAADPAHPVNRVLEGSHFECGRERLGAATAFLFEGYYRPDLRRRGQLSEQLDGLASETANVPAIREAAAGLFASAGKLRNEAAQRAERRGEARLVWTGREDVHEDRFSRALHAMKARPEFHYVDGNKHRFHRPRMLVELLRLMQQYPQARLVAGGGELLRRAESGGWPHLLSLECVGELTQVTTGVDHWEIGAAVSLTRVAEALGGECAPFAKALRRYGTRPVRNQATLGGCLATARSSSSLNPLLMALNARVVLVSPEGERDAPISQFFQPGEKTILGSGEIIRSVVVPRSTESLLAERGITSRICDIYAVAPRRNSPAPRVTGAFALELRENLVAKAWIAYAGISDEPVRAREAEEVLAGKPWNEDSLMEALRVLNRTVKIGDAQGGGGGGGYRKQLVITLFQKFFHQHPTADSSAAVGEAATAEFAQFNQSLLHD